MLRIDCPWCGPRAESEYRCGGESLIQRPPLDCSDAEWADYLHTRKNPKGVHVERWHHVHGCGMWFNAARSTVSHEIHATWAMTDPVPELPE